MRFVFLILLALLSGSAIAADKALTISEAQEAAGAGDAQAAAALTMKTDRTTCMNECARRGNGNAQCVEACQPGLCHPNASTPYCISQ